MNFYELAARARRLIALSLLWAGRVLLVLAPVLAVACRRFREIWSSAELDSAGFSTHWLPNATILASFLWSYALSALVLPVSSDALSKVTGTTLVARTVLGERTLPLPARSLHSVRLPGRGWGLQLFLVRAGGLRFCVLATSELWNPSDVLSQVSAKDERPQRSALAGAVGMTV